LESRSLDIYLNALVGRLSADVADGQRYVVTIQDASLAIFLL
jgi:hypothetical protein